MTTDTAAIESQIDMARELLKGLPDTHFDGLRRVFERDSQWLERLTRDLPGALAGAIGHAVDELEAAGAIHTSQPPKGGLETLWWDAIAHATEHDDPATLRALVKALEAMNVW